MNREEVSTMLQRILQGAPFSMKDWAEGSGVSYPSFRSWAYGKRVPTPDKIERLAEALEGRADQLRRMAEELRQGAEASKDGA